MATKRSKMRIRSKGAAKATATLAANVEGGVMKATLAQTEAHPARRLDSNGLFKKSRDLGVARAPKISSMRLRCNDAAKAITTTAMKVEDGATTAAMRIENGATTTAMKGDDGAVAETPASTSDILPLDPQDRRLTLEGIVLDGKGKIDISAYKDLMPAFKNEPPRNLHPHPDMPGVRANEQIPKGLRVWDDVQQGHNDRDGAGWIALLNKTATRQKREKWFNIRICGSWRMAFLMSVLQRAYWEDRAAWPSNPKKGAAASAKRKAASTVAPSKVAKASVTPRRTPSKVAKASVTLRLRKDVQLKKKWEEKHGAQPKKLSSPSARNAKAPRKAVTRSDEAQEQAATRSSGAEEEPQAEPQEESQEEPQPLPPKQMEFSPIINPATLESSVWRCVCGVCVV